MRLVITQATSGGFILEIIANTRSATIELYTTFDKLEARIKSLLAGEVAE